VLFVDQYSLGTAVANLQSMTNEHYLLEISTGSVEDCITAESGGADRVELNSALAVGGLTPSLGTLIEVKARTQLPVIVMVRPRPGGFCYSDVEFATMQRDIDLLLVHKADGIAFGVLNDDGTVDIKRNQILVDQVRDAVSAANRKRAVVFHRAFDVVPDSLRALSQLVEIGFDRLMTSGQESNAYFGLKTIGMLHEKASGCIEILPAGGVNRFTVRDILNRTGCRQIHASLSGLRNDPSTSARPQIRYGAPTLPPEDQYSATDRDAVVDMRGRLDEFVRSQDTDSQ
jgi:copper homeostasis protein